MASSASYATLVQELYVAYFGRPADVNGWQNFEAALASANAPTTLTGLLSVYGTNAAVTSLIDAFGNSAESGHLYGTNIASSTTAAQNFVTAVFESLFNRAPLAAGLAFWSHALTSGNLTPGAAALSIAAGAGTADAATVANKLAAAADFTNDLATHGNVGLTAYTGAFAAAEGRTFLSQIDGSTTSTVYDAFASSTTNAMVNGSVPPPIQTTTTPPPVPTPTVALTVFGDTIHLSGTTAASTVTLTGADLANFPAATYGTVAELLTHSVTSVTDSGGNFTLNASGNSSATTFNFGTGAVSGADPASAAGITYSGVTTYVTSTHADTVTLSAATQNVTASSFGDTINLGNLTYTGTLNLNAGSGGTDTINANVGGNLSGATISGNGSGAQIALVLSNAGSETLNTAEYNTITSTTHGSISFAGTGGTDRIIFSNAGTVTAISNVGNYTLSAAGNTITLNNVAENVNGDANGGTDVVNLAALAYTGTLALFGSGGTDTVQVTVGGNISGGTVTGSGVAVALALSGAGAETLSAAEYNLFNAGGISGGSFGGNTITLSNAGTVTANVNVGNYHLATAGDTITLNNVADNVTGAASGNDIVNLAALAYTGTVAFGAAGTDSIHVTVGHDISGATITTGGATVGLVFSGPGTETMKTGQYNLFNAGGISGGSFGGDTITFSNAGTVTANANVGNYDLSTAGNTITLTNAADHVTGAASGSDTVDLAALTYTGTTAFGASGSDVIHVTVNGDIHGGSITTGGATVALVLSGAGAETLSTEEFNLFNATSITGGTAGSNTFTFSDAGTVTDNADVGNYHLSTAGNTITLTSDTDNVTGAAGGNDIVAIPQFSFGGTLAFGASGTDIVQAPTNGDFSGLTVSTGGATLELMITGVASGVPSGSTTTTEIYNEFTTGPHAGGIVFPAGGDTNPADYIMAFSDQGTVSDSANITNYYLNASVHSTINDIYTFTIANNAADNITEFSAATGGSTYNLDVSTFTGSISLGSSGTDTISVAAGNDISGGQITSSGTAAALSVTGSGTVTVSSAEAALFHAAPSAIAAAGTDTMDVADATSPINLNAQENALTTVGLQAGSNTVNVSVGANSVNASAAGFNQTIVENGAGGNTFNIDNGAATIAGAIDSMHHVTINNFNTASDNLALTLSGVAQNAGEQDISDSGNDTFTVANNGVIVLTNLGALPGFTLFNATDLSSAANNMLLAVNASTATTGEYTFVVDTNQGAGIYEVHINSGGGTIDGIQLIGVVHGVGSFNLVNLVG
ncbi:MAG TPA: DUF4214 domain-containing protein [Burkholderiaceae bacterium]